MSYKTIAKTLVGFKGYAVDSVEIQVGERPRIDVKVHLTRGFGGRDPITGKKAPLYDRPPSVRRWRGLDAGAAEVFVEMPMRRVLCGDGRVRAEAVPFARPGSSFTADFEDQVAWMACFLPKSAVSELMAVDWATVGRCVERSVTAWGGKGAERLDGLTAIGVDETSYKKGYKYMTVVVDHSTRRVVWCHKGHGKEVLDLFFAELGPERSGEIACYTADGAKYIAESFAEHCPKAIRCLDPFHLVGWADEALDEVRKECWRKANAAVKKLKKAEERKRKEAGGGERKPGRPRKGEGKSLALKKAEEKAEAVKGARFALLWGGERLSEFNLARIRFIAKTQPSLYKAYEIKEMIRSATGMTAEGASETIDYVVMRCSRSRNEAMKALGKKIKRHKEAILNTISFGFTNAIVESVNGKIKKIIRMANGFKNVDNMISLIMLKLGGVKIPLPYKRIADSPTFMPE